MFLAGDGAEFSDFGFKARKETIEDTDEILLALVSKQVEFKNPGAGAPLKQTGSETLVEHAA